MGPQHIHFGHVQPGHIVCKTAKLHNLSADTGRFVVKQTQAPLQIKFKPGLIAAGMYRLLEIRFTAQKVGDFCGDIYIDTEFHKFCLSVSAKVVGPPEGLPDMMEVSGQTQLTKSSASS